MKSSADLKAEWTLIGQIIIVFIGLAFWFLGNIRLTMLSLIFGLILAGTAYLMWAQEICDYIAARKATSSIVRMFFYGDVMTDRWYWLLGGVMYLVGGVILLGMFLATI